MSLTPRVAPNNPARIFGAAGSVAAGFGVYAGAWGPADALLIAAAVFVVALGERRGLRYLVNYRAAPAYIFWPLLLGSAWSAAPGEGLALTGRLAGLVILWPILPKQGRLIIPLLLVAMTVGAAAEFANAPYSDGRARSLSLNAVTLGELGMFAIMAGSPFMALQGVVMVGVSGSRAALAATLLFCGLSGRRTLWAVGAVSLGLWLGYVTLSGTLGERVSLYSVSHGLAARGDAAGVSHGGFETYVADLYGVEQPVEPESPDWRDWARSHIGAGTAGFQESTGRQRPHSVPILLWRELGALAALPLFGLVMMLRRLPAVMALALAGNYIVFSDSVYGDPAGLYAAACGLAIWAGGGWPSWRPRGVRKTLSPTIWNPIAAASRVRVSGRSS